MRDTFKRVFKAGWVNFKRNSYLSFGTTGVMTLVLLLFAGLITLNFLSSTIVGSLESKVDISVYFKTDASEDEIAQVQKDLTSNPLVKSVDYISKDKALADFKTLHAGDALIQDSLAELDDNPLQAALNIKAKDPNQYASIVQFLEANKFRSFINKINYYENENVIKRVQGISDGLKNWGLLSTLILAVIAVLVTFNTIRLTIYNQRNEIEIMRLVGGSNWHIKAPYLVEGGLYGGLAAVIAMVVFYPIVIFASPKVSLLVPGTSLIHYFGVNSLQFVSIMLFVGILLGVVSSFVAIRKFLKI